MELVLWIFLLSMYVCVIYSVTKYVYTFFKKKHWVTLNFEHKPVVQSFGVNVFFHYAIFLFISYGFNFWIEMTIFQDVTPVIFMLLMVILSVMGWVDDRYGAKNIKGFKGHFKTFFSDKKVTTGFMKALIGLSLALGVSYYYSATGWMWAMNTFVFVLSIHTINLMDVRPGRAIKSFWLLTLCIVVFFPSMMITTLYIPVILSTIILFHYDRQRMAMLGDTGAIVLGGILGYFLVTAVGLEVKIVYVSVFALLAVIAEKFSFSSYIKNTPWLSKIDRWGIR